MKDPRDIILAPVVSEKSYGLIEQGVYTFKVHPSASKPEIPDAVEAIWGVEVLQGQHPQPQGQGARAPAAPTASVSKPDTKRAIVTLAAGERSRCSRTERTMAIRSRKPTSPGRRFQTTLRLLRDHQDHAREVAARRRSRRPAAATSTAARRRATAVAATSSSTASSTSSASRTA